MIDLTHTKVEEFIMTVQTPYRYDVVGSFLRPEKLKQARKDYESKKISREELTQIEDECITDLVQKEKAAGLHVITDGEFRRATWHLDFMWGFDGVSTILRLKENLKILQLTHTYVVVTSTLHMHLVVLMMLSQKHYLRKKMYMPIS